MGRPRCPLLKVLLLALDSRFGGAVSGFCLDAGAYLPLGAMAVSSPAASVMVRVSREMALEALGLGQPLDWASQLDWA